MNQRRPSRRLVKIFLLVWIALGCAGLACQSVTRLAPTAAEETASPSSAKTLPLSTCQQTVDRLAKMIAVQPIPQNLLQENPQHLDTDFDPNQVFTALTHLSMQPGYVLDFVYYFDGFGGGPLVYARPTGQAPFKTVKEYQSTVGSGAAARTAYLQHIQSDGSQDAFLELALLRILGDRFYLYWHSNYGGVEIICDPLRLNSLVDELAHGKYGSKLMLDDQLKANALAARPAIHLQDSQVTVELLTFCRFGGFNREIYTFNRQPPFQILSEKVEKLVPYEAGIQF